MAWSATPSIVATITLLSSPDHFTAFLHALAQTQRIHPFPWFAYP
jgi:hypothetical protein